MLYSEFISGTKCRDNAHNYEVYKALEALYMNSDATKADVYKAARPFLNNEKSAEQVAAEQEIIAAAEIEERRAEYARWNIEYHEAIDDKKTAKYYKNEYRTATAKAKMLRGMIE